ncbi:hypothetical protein OK351_05245 [Glutamicibacter sp. MNS18]|uniref:hypothetical protein n=1 Tax=Glutamicibacter sp. MNS18 TaxID=2989817 RepID=UPI002236236E|nr:hypothetical protein [Glutamicibacter sp. MNS18]MCW4464912.1 hypothetical protein [Glutamicibacter sp. MNS18]
MGDLAVLDTGLIAAIEAEDPIRAAGIATLFTPQTLVETLDYHRITDNAEPYGAFLKAWFEVASPLDRPVIVSWGIDIATSEFAYLEIQAELAEMQVRSVHDAKDYLAGIIEHMYLLTDNPEAGLA